jgi:DNA-binding transcriptional regulator LsrR (DeoR family)
MSEIKLTKAQREERFSKAQYMVLVQGINQKEVSKALGISERTLTTWAKLCNWKQERKAINAKNGLEGIIEGNFELIEQRTSLQNRVKMKAIWTEYLQTLRC